MEYKFTTGRTIPAILVYFLAFLAGDLLSSLACDLIFSFVTLPASELYFIVRTVASLLLTLLLFWLCTAKWLRRKWKDFGITPGIRWWGAALSVLLPALVAAAFLAVGDVRVNALPAASVVLTVAASVLMALKAGILEEMLFRGFIMRLLEARWGRFVAIAAPSFLFSLVHIPSMETVTAGGVLLLVLSGTLVGVLFSMAACAGHSIANSALMHAVWNLVMVTDLLHITTEQGTYGRPIFSIILPSDAPLLTGAGFGVEASLIAIAGYALACLVLLWIPRKELRR